MSECVDVVVAGEDVQLFADRALFWPRAHWLLIADLHLGKADTFRSAGIPLPSGGTRHDLERLTRLIDQTHATRLIVLGDLLHSDATELRWREAWNAWRTRHANLLIDVVMGNHDRALHSARLDVQTHSNSLRAAPFDLRHAPRVVSDSHVVAGHVHPVARIPGSKNRWPVFVLDEELTILPAFSAFTGGFEVDVRKSRLAVCNGSQIALIGSR